MSTNTTPISRRERNKQQKLERIIDAARELFAERGVDEVTTQEIAERADIGTGTLFLYAKTKGELLLLVQNSLYAKALGAGRAAAQQTLDVPDAVLAVVRPIVECNRVQIDNGRTYLREMVFGDPADPQHAEALRIVAETEVLVAEVLRRNPRTDEQTAQKLAHVVSAILFLDMAASINAALSAEELLDDIATQVRAILPR